MRARIAYLLLLARTVRHLRAAQVLHRFRLRLQKQALKRWPEPIAGRLRRAVPARPSWPNAFVAIEARLAEGYPGAQANAQGTFTFMNQMRDLGDPHDWEQSSASQLWRYHLHYFDWATSFVNHPNREWARTAFLGLWRSWQEGTRFGRWDAWSPYVVSLRTWNLCVTYTPLVAGTDTQDEYLSDLALHAGFVQANLELDVGGNHLMKNIKALIGAGVFLSDGGMLRRACGHLAKQLPVQILADGGHFERSPSYHCQVLGDLIDIEGLLLAAGKATPTGLGEAIARMRRWLGAILMPDGDVPPFNDCQRLGPLRIAAFRPEAPSTRRLVVLPHSGYVVIRPNSRIHLVADIGLPCPAELPAHAHSDCLSFELAVDGKRVIVDTGTSTYEPGHVRDYERSTKAHNTVVVDGSDQTEVWGAFRAARRAQPTLHVARELDDNIEVCASHDGYERLGGRPRHMRTWRVTGSEIQIDDNVEGNGNHRVQVFLHLAPGISASEGDEAIQAGPLRIAISATDGAGLQTRVSDTDLVASEFNARQPTATLAAEIDAELPVRLRTSFTIPTPCRLDETLQSSAQLEGTS